jgi:D-threo-aldose 1-dehydrogenase
MRYLDFPGQSADGAAGTPMSVLGFGCSALLGRASRKESEQAVGAAIDAGITFYDTARSYGYGGSEGLLGTIFHTRRHRMVLCTKFGILPAAPDGLKERIKPLARALVKAVPALRTAAQRAAATQLTPGQFNLETMHASVETSLRELRTDYLDILLLHAAPASVLAQDDLLEALSRLVESGKVRMAGISGERSVIEQTFAQKPPVLQTAQFALNAGSMSFCEQTRKHADMLLVANHPFGGPDGDSRKWIERLRRAAGPELGEKLAPGDPQVLPEVILNCILDGTGISAVVPAMMQPAHIESNVRAVSECRFTSEELEMMRGLLS